VNSQSWTAEGIILCAAVAGLLLLFASGAAGVWLDRKREQRRAREREREEGGAR